MELPVAWGQPTVAKGTAVQSSSRLMQEAAILAIAILTAAAVEGLVSRMEHNCSWIIRAVLDPGRATRSSVCESVERFADG